MSRGRTATRQESVQNARKKLTQFIKTLDTVPKEEMERTAQTIYSKAVAMTPYKTGKLEHAVYARVSKSRYRPGIVAGASARATNGYNYAGIQHENEHFNHPIKGSDHFISKPFTEETQKLKRRLRRRLRIDDSR